MLFELGLKGSQSEAFVVNFLVEKQEKACSLTLFAQN